jgi:hypothetical protein
MAVGFPVKANYATGDVLSAANMNDLSGTLNTLQGVSNNNPIINSAMQVWQRGTSFSIAASSDAYTADRWRQFTQANQATTVSRQVTNDTTNLPFIQYCTRIQRNSGQTGTGQMSFIQGLETINTIPYVGKTVTLSFYARAGANFSPTSSGLTIFIYTGTGTDQFPTSYTGGAGVGAATVNLTTTWVRYSITGAIPTTVTELGPYFNWLPTGTAGTNDYVEITGVQLEVGSVATPFNTFGGTIENELAACQRYYTKTYAQGTAPATATSTNIMASIIPTSGTGSFFLSARFPVTMRGTPTITAYDSAGASGKVYKGADGKTAVTQQFGDAGGRIGTSDATSANELLFHYTADAEL